jgi:drug/metabolite transporter (DMT)-like permease
MLCVAGLAVLIYPAAAEGASLGLWLALGSALSWAAGTIYLKWARIKGDVIAITAWQLMVSLLVIAACVVAFEGVPHVWPLSAAALACLVYHGTIGTGVAYFLWFEVVGRLPAATASLGTLLVPVIGILGAVALLGERPSVADAVGFTLIFIAAACVLMPRFRSA